MRFLFLLLGCLLVGFAAAHRDEQPQAGQITQASVAGSVQIAHRLVTVEPERQRPVHVIKAAQKAQRVTRTDTPPRAFLARARQLVLGDGRFRPAPFPQPSAR